MGRIYETAWIPKPKDLDMDSFMDLVNKTIQGYNVISIETIYDAPGMFAEMKFVDRVKGIVVLYWKEPVRNGRQPHMIHQSPEYHKMLSNSGKRKS